MEGRQELDIIITLIAGTLAVLTMSVAIIISVIKYQKNVLKQKEVLAQTEKRFQTELLDATIIASEKERELIAKNIHDDIGVLTNVIKMNNSQIKVRLKDEDATSELIKTNNQLLLEINDNIKSISSDLVSPTLTRYGFVKALEQLCSKLPSTLKVHLNYPSEDMRFDKKTESQMFRSCKEVLNNIIKHSSSSEITIDINFAAGQLMVSMCYNGSGIDNEEVKSIMKTNKGLGLKSIYGRMQILGGQVNYFKKQGINEVSLSVPIPVIANV
jgi:signal transduction histidine kinase